MLITLAALTSAGLGSPPPLVGPPIRIDPSAPPPIQSVWNPPVATVPIIAPSPPPPPPRRLPERPSAELLNRPVPPKPHHPLFRLFNAADYPASSLRAGREGNVAAIVTVSVEGRVDGCYIDVSAGDVGLDAATCRILGSRARFDPARDKDGKPVRAAVPVQISWRLPVGARIPLTAWRSQVNAKVAKDGRLLSCSETMEGINRPPGPSCRNFNGIPGGVVAQGADGKPSTLSFETRLIPNPLRNIADLPAAQGEVLFRVAARLAIGRDGQMASCELIETSGLLIAVSRRPVECRTLFRGPYVQPTEPTEVTVLVTASRVP